MYDVVTNFSHNFFIGIGQKTPGRKMNTSRATFKLQLTALRVTHRIFLTISHLLDLLWSDSGMWELERES